MLKLPVVVLLIAVLACTDQTQDVIEPAKEVSQEGFVFVGANSDTSPPDSEEVCGDGVCAGPESASSCSADCVETCGNGLCLGGETALSCAADCPAVCGDGACTGTEGSSSCAEDCGTQCGDGVCNEDEDTVSCAEDCGTQCGDGVCNEDEDTVSCSLDCGSAPDELMFNIIIRQTYKFCSGCGIWFDWQGKQANKPRLVVKYKHAGALHTAEYQHGLGGMDNAHSIWIQSGKAHDEGNKHQMLIKKGPHRNGLLRVDASDIPVDATITETRLHLHINKQEGLANGDHSSILMVHESAQDWDWNSVSWTHAATGQPWTTKGGDLGIEVREMHAGEDMHDLGFNKAHPNGSFDFTPYMQLLQSERGLGNGTVCGDGLCAGSETLAICPQDCGNQNNPDPETTTARYVRVTTTESPSWVAWFEIQALDANGTNVALGKTANASSSSEDQTPQNIIDGNNATSWGSGDFPPATITIDLGQPMAISSVRMLVGQMPEGVTSHTLLFGDKAQQYTEIKTFSGNTKNGDWLVYGD